MKEQYRYENGSLYKYSNEEKAYVHVYKNSLDNTNEKAISAYERALHEESLS